MGKITDSLKQKAIKVYEETGLLKEVAKSIGVDVSTLRREMKHSAVFRKKMKAALELGLMIRGDEALQTVVDYAAGIGMNANGKSDRNQLTAALALSNAFVPGFKPVAHVDHKVSGSVKFKTSIPRPKYVETTKQKRVRIPAVSQNLIALTGSKQINDDHRDS